MANPLTELTLEDLRRRTSIKWSLYPADVLPLWVAEADVPLAPAVATALHAAVDRGDTGYPVAERYVDAAADFAKARWDWSFDHDQAVIVPDVMRGIVEVLHLVSDPGSAVVVNSPVYAQFYEFVRHMDRIVVEAPLGESLRLDLEVLREVFERARPAAYLLCSPHNPTGTVHTAEELGEVIALADEYGVRIVVDEIHAPLVYPDQTYRPFLTVPGSQTAIVLHSASKAWNLAGLKSAVAIAGDRAVDDLRRMPLEASHGASHVGAIAHIAAYRDGRDWLDDLLEGLDANRRLLSDLLAEQMPGIGYRPPEGTYLAWLDCRSLGLGEDPAAVFLERGRVAFSSGPTFGTGGAGFVRFNLATHPDIVCEAVARMQASPSKDKGHAFDVRR